MKKIFILILLSMFLVSGCTKSPTACTLEAKICPDGSAVGRTSPDCEFEVCPEPKSGCSINSDCVPASCCHPSSCVPASQAPACKDILCTMNCEPGTMDCGQGSCQCIEGKCNAIIN